MTTYYLENDVKVFGVQVKNFPVGIGEAFEHLRALLPPGDRRSFYGIFQMDENGTMLYYATAEEIHEGEAEKYKCNRHNVEKGGYLSETIRGWPGKIASIKAVFQKLTTDPRADTMKPGVEWYKDEMEMLCMVKLNSSRAAAGKKNAKHHDFR